MSSPRQEATHSESSAVFKYFESEDELNNERQRVIFGPEAGQAPSALGLMTVHLVGMRCPAQTLKRLRDALSMLFHCKELLCQKLEGEQTHWVTESEREDIIRESARKWFASQRWPCDKLIWQEEQFAQLLHERDWEWWSGRVIEDQFVALEILVFGFPISGFDALRWLGELCGAREVKQVKERRDGVE